MNKNGCKLLSIILSVLLLITAMPPSTLQAAETSRQAVIYSYSGTVFIRRGGDKEIAVFEGMRLETGDTIITESNSSAVLAIDSDKTITIDESSEATLDNLSGDETKSDTSVSVFFGSIINNIKQKLTTGSTFETKTANATMGVRGTTYLVNQTSSSSDIIVTTGTVAIYNTSEQEEETVLINAGSIYHASPGMIKPAPAPLSSDSLLLLTPTEADALFLDAETLPLDIFPNTVTSYEELRLLLAEKQKEKNKLVSERISQQKQAIREKEKSQPAPYFEATADTLSGQSNILLVPQNASQKENTSPPETKKASDSETSGLTEQNKETVQPASNTEKDKENAAVNDTQSKPGKENENLEGNTGNQTNNSDDDDSNSGNDDDGNDDGSNDDGSNDDGSNNNTTPPPTPSKPQVSVGGLTIDCVYESVAGVPANGLLYLCVSFSKAEQTSGYLLDLKNGSNYVPLSFAPMTAENNGTMRLFFPAAERANLNGKVLRVTPKTGTNMTAVSSEITLDFEAAPSQTVKKLSTPNAGAVSITYNAPTLTVEFPSYEDSSEYLLELYLNNQMISSSKVIAANGNGQYSFSQDNLNGSVHVTLKAIGNDFNLLQSETAVSPSFLFSTAPKLPAPVTEIQTGANKNHLVWSPVNSAANYEICFNDSITVTQGYSFSYGKMMFDLSMQTVPTPITSIKIRAISAEPSYLNSDWTLVDISSLLLPNTQVRGSL